MAVELQPPEHPIPPAAATALPLAEDAVPQSGSKRQCRPSVRLGEIGDQPATLRPRNPWSLRYSSSKPSKARPVTNLIIGHDIPEDSRTFSNDKELEFGNKRAKSKRRTATKRGRSTWVSKIDGGTEEGNNGHSREGNNNNSKFQDFGDLETDGPVHSADNDPWRDQVENDAIELDNDNLRLSNCEGVKSWLIELGLSRYAPVFEMHEVDDDVLPLLTLEDLKDMGINAVGSRRKMYTAIEKLRKGYLYWDTITQTLATMARWWMDVDGQPPLRPDMYNGKSNLDMCTEYLAD